MPYSCSISQVKRKNNIQTLVLTCVTFTSGFAGWEERNPQTRLSVIDFSRVRNGSSDPIQLHMRKKNRFILSKRSLTIKKFHRCRKSQFIPSAKGDTMWNKMWCFSQRCNHLHQRFVTFCTWNKKLFFYLKNSSFFLSMRAIFPWKKYTMCKRK